MALAEREGFEPSVPRKEDNGFRVLAPTSPSVSRYAGMYRVTCRVPHVATILIPVNPGPLLPVRWQIWWQFLCESQGRTGRSQNALVLLLRCAGQFRYIIVSAAFSALSGCRLIPGGN